MQCLGQLHPNANIILEGKDGLVANIYFGWNGHDVDLR